MRRLVRTRCVCRGGDFALCVVFLLANVKKKKMFLKWEFCAISSSEVRSASRLPLEEPKTPEEEGFSVLKGGKAHKGGRRSLAALVIEPDKIKSGRLRRVWRDGHSPPAPGEAFHHRSQGEKKKKSLICSSMQDCKQSVASEGSMSVAQ